MSTTANESHEVKRSGMPRPATDSVQVALRLPREWLAKADELARRISRPGVTMSRADAFRAAMAAGFDALEGEGQPAPSTKARKK